MRKPHVEHPVSDWLSERQMYKKHIRLYDLAVTILFIVCVFFMGAWAVNNREYQREKAAAALYKELWSECIKLNFKLSD
jgi:Ni,Fe-hydrogenase I cytochrome b subunit